MEDASDNITKLRDRLKILENQLSGITGKLNAIPRADDNFMGDAGSLFHFLEAVPVGVFIVDAEGKPFYANHASRAICESWHTKGMRVRRLIYSCIILGSGALWAWQRPGTKDCCILRQSLL